MTHWTTRSLERAHAGSSSAGKILMKAPDASLISFMMLPALRHSRTC